MASLGPVPRALLAVIVACLAFGWWSSRTPAVPLAVDAGRPGGACQLPPLGAAASPIQREVPGTPPFQLGEHRVTPRAAFAVDAAVLGAERYRFGREAALSPIDLALGWGPMADPGVYGALDISQSGRWYHYRWGPEGPPVPLETIIRHSSNMHLIPANGEIAARLLRIEAGQRVRLTGWLVDVETADGFRWSTSLSRDDSGDGACEVVYVCDVVAAP